MLTDLCILYSLLNDHFAHSKFPVERLL